MKSIILTTAVFFFIFAGSLKAQSVCYSFDDVTLATNYDQQQAFYVYGNGNGGFLTNWDVTSGTPAIVPSVDSLNAYDGDQFALIAVCNSDTNFSEGVALKYNFIPGQTYIVSMAAANEPLTQGTQVPINVQFILMKDSIHYLYNPNTGCSATPYIDSNDLPIFGLDSFVQSSWKVISFEITNLSADYNYLWFRVGLLPNAPLATTFFCFDSMCIRPSVTGIADLEPAAKSYLLQNTPNPFAASTTISYYLSDAKNASIVIHDLLGRVVNTIPVSGKGKGSVTFYNSQLSPGIYLYSLMNDGVVLGTKRMIVGE